MTKPNNKEEWFLALFITVVGLLIIGHDGITPENWIGAIPTVIIVIGAITYLVLDKVFADRIILDKVSVDDKDGK